MRHEMGGNWHKEMEEYFTKLNEAKKFVHPDPSLQLHKVHFQDNYIIASDGFSIYRANNYATVSSKRFFSDEFMAKFFENYCTSTAIQGERMMHRIEELRELSSEEKRPHLRIGVGVDGDINAYYICDGIRYNEKYCGESIMEFNVEGYKIDTPPLMVAFNFNANCIRLVLPGSTMVILKNTKGE